MRKMFSCSRLSRRVCLGCAGDHRAGAHMLEYGCFQEKADALGRLAREDFLVRKSGAYRCVPEKLATNARGSSWCWSDGPGVQSDCPASVRASSDASDSTSRLTGCLLEEPCGFVGVNRRSAARPHQLTASTEARQRQRRIAAGGDDQTQLRR